jgi:hypothetical protein
MPAYPGVAQMRKHKRRNLSWQEKAACLDANPKIFFDPDRYGEALSFCARCPEDAKKACRELGKGTEGVWGGRVHMARKKARP